jgi:single-strand DNA-binding protein
MINIVTLVGRLGGDPEFRDTRNGAKYAKLTLATNKLIKQGEEYKEETEWHNILVFNKALVGIVTKSAAKGTLMFVQGAMQTRTYEVEGQRRYTTEVVCGGFEHTIKILSSNAKKPDNNTNTSGDTPSEDIPF